MAPIDEALDFLNSSESVNYAETARVFNCDETTLRRRHQGKQRSRQDANRLYKSRLSKEQERDLIAYIHKLSSRGIPPTLPMIKNFAQDIAKTEVGKNWPYSFVQRNRDELGCTWFDGLDIARKKGDNASRYRAYFELITKKAEDDSDTGGDFSESTALQHPTARDLCRLVDKVFDKFSSDADRNSQKLKSTLESLQAEVELLRYENQGLRETIIHEKQRRMRGKALKDYLFDRTDPNSAQVFTLAKVAQARLKKAAIDTQKKEEALQKETQKAQRRQQAAEQKVLALEKRRQREAEMERKQQIKESRRQEREADRQIRQGMKRRNQEMAHKIQHERQVASKAREKSSGFRDEIIAALPPTSGPSVASQAPDLLKVSIKRKVTTTPIHIARPKRLSLAVESDREMVVVFRSSGQPQRNSKQPRWLDNYEIA
ncbi:DDE superfamily endonuclease, CENP-B-like protein [Ilyonectria robusta]